MADVTISGLPSASAMSDDNVLPIVQGGTTKKASRSLFLADEVSARASKDDALSQAISVLSQAGSVEAATRSTADAGLSSRIDVVSQAISILSQGLSVVSNAASDALSVGRAASAAAAIALSIISTTVSAGIADAKSMASVASVGVDRVSQAVSVLSVQVASVQSALSALSADFLSLKNRVSANSGTGGGVTPDQLSAVSLAAQSALSTETSARIAADSALSTLISALSQQLSLDRSAISQVLSVHSQALSVHSQAISVISQQVSVLSVQVASVQSALSQETSARVAGDSALSTAISAVSQQLSLIASALSQQISVEKARAISEESRLSLRIDAGGGTNSVTSNELSATAGNLLSAQNVDTSALSAGQPVYAFGVSAGVPTFKRANASAAATKNVLGLVRDTNIAVSAVGLVQMGGLLSLATATWDAIVSGQTGGLAPGTEYYLDTVDGFLTKSVPGGGVGRPVGVAVTSTMMRMNIAPIDDPNSALSVLSQQISALSQAHSALSQAVSLLSVQLSLDRSAISQVLSVHSQQISVISNALSVETSARIAGDSALSTLISALSQQLSLDRSAISQVLSVHSQAISVISQALSAETSARIAADSALSTLISALSQQLSLDRSAISQVLSVHSQAISVISQQVSALSQAVSVADAALSVRIDTQSQAISVLSQQISVLSQAHSALSQAVSLLSVDVASVKSVVSSHSTAISIFSDLFSTLRGGTASTFLMKSTASDFNWTWKSAPAGGAGGASVTSAMQGIVLRLQNNDSVTLSAGAPVYLQSGVSVGVSAYYVARANASATDGKRDVIGLLIDGSLAVSAVGQIQTEGVVSLTMAQWNAVVSGQVSGLTPGVVYYLDVTPGLLTSTPPATGALRRVGVALDNTHMRLQAAQMDDVQSILSAAMVSGAATVSNLISMDNALSANHVSLVSDVGRISVNASAMSTAIDVISQAVSVLSQAVSVLSQTVSVISAGLGGVQMRYVSTANTIAGSGISNISGLSISLAANATYQVEGQILYNISAISTPGIGFGMSYPTMAAAHGRWEGDFGSVNNPQWVFGNSTFSANPAGNRAVAYWMESANNAQTGVIILSALSAPPASAGRTYWAKVEGLFNTSAAGTMAVVIREPQSQVVILKGSYIRAFKIA